MGESGDIVDDVFPLTGDVISDTEYWALVRDTSKGKHHHKPVREVDYSIIDDSNKRAREAKAAEEAAAAD